MTSIDLRTGKEWAHKGKKPMTVGDLIQALEKFPTNTPVLIYEHQEDEDMMSFSSRIYDVEAGFADTNITSCMTFSSRRFHDSEPCVRILGSDDEPDEGTVVVVNGIRPHDS